MILSYTTGLHSLADFLKPWQSLFSNSKVISDGTTFLHLAGVLFAGGFAIAADRAILRGRGASSGERARLLGEIKDIHPPVLIGLGVLFGSGLLLATSDVETFGKSPVFLIKMTLVALLLVNGIVLERTEKAFRNHSPSDVDVVNEQLLCGKLRRTAVASITLWTSIVLAGTILVNS